MRILAFDTATPLTSVALRDFGEKPNVCMLTTLDLTAVDDPPAGGRPGHAQKLLGLIQGLLDQAGVTWDQIDRLAVGVGPGTFTGLRIGIATAHALAQSTGTPLVGVSTLRSLEQASRPDPDDSRPILAVIDARRGEAFVAGAGLSPRVLTPEALGSTARWLEGGLAGINSSREVTAVGDGAIKFRAVLEHAGVTVPPDDSPRHRVSAREHCRLALTAQPNATNTVDPEYLRLPDAELALRT